MTNPFEDFAAHAKRMQAETDAHRASCAAQECARCERFLCRKCKAPGVGHADAACEKCWKEREHKRRTRVALEQIPKAFAEASLEASWLVSLVGHKVIADARAAAGDARVAAIGPPGSGKTSLVAAMFVLAAVPGSRPLWVSAHQLAKARAFHRLGEGEAPLIADAMGASVLAVDELGGEDQRYASAVAEVLYERHAAGAPTWVTTGVGPKEIGDRYGGGIARRVFEDAKVFRLPGRVR